MGMTNFSHDMKHSWSVAWGHMLDTITSKLAPIQTHTVLAIPVSYLHSISGWPMHNLAKEAMVSPPAFISLLCCLPLENIKDSAVDKQHQHSLSAPECIP